MARSRSKAKAKPKRAKTKPKSAKTKPKTKSTRKRPRGFGDLAAWQQVPFAEGHERYDFAAATNDSLHWEDAFGDEPTHLMVAHGDQRITGDVKLRGWDAPDDCQQTAYIVDGSLAVDGSIVASQSDISTTLWITGDLTVKRLVLAGGAMLLVTGSLTVEELLVTNLDDAGHLIVGKELAAPAWIDVAYNGRGCIELGSANGARLLSDYHANQPLREAGEGPIGRYELPRSPATPMIRPELHDGESASFPKLLAAIESGTPVLRDSPQKRYTRRDGTH